MLLHHIDILWLLINNAPVILHFYIIISFCIFMSLKLFTKLKKMILKNLTTGIPVLQDGWITVVFWWVVFFFIILRKIEFSFGGWGREEVVAGTPFWGYAQELGQVRIPYEWTLAAVTPELDFMMYCIIPFQVFHTFSISPCNMDFCWQRLERRGKNSECAKDKGL